MTRDQWKLVTDEAELKVGMTVELRPCAWCRKRCRFMISERWFSDGGNCIVCGRQLAARAIGSCDDTRPHCTCNAIRERRLYALIDDDTAADETTVTRRREMVE